MKAHNPTPVQLREAPRSGLLAVCLSTLRRDLLVRVRNAQDLVNPLIFFVIVVSLFPLGVSPQEAFLRTAGPGVIWVAALLAVLLSLDSLFRDDYEDGSLDQWLLIPQPLFVLVLVRVLCHWCLAVLPLIVLAPLLGLMMHMPPGQIGVLCLTLLLGTPVLSLVGSMGAALTVGLGGGGVLLSLLVLPLYVPVLLFATGAVMAAAEGASYSPQLMLLGALLALAVTLAPLASAGALRISASQG
ncbi:MAG: heme exporter protein CcmB [Oleiphilaceae bacterium]|nr:heme exporter protein CcmB [Oleiphilaceae bacterium]